MDREKESKREKALEIQIKDDCPEKMILMNKVVSDIASF